MEPKISTLVLALVLVPVLALLGKMNRWLIYLHASITKSKTGVLFFGDPIWCDVMIRAYPGHSFDPWNLGPNSS